MAENSPGRQQGRLAADLSTRPDLPLSKHKCLPNERRWTCRQFDLQRRFRFQPDWRATLSPAGSASSPLTPATPQPVAPTGCKFTGGSGGVCGLVGFNCDPFSGVDEIIVKSGNVFVTVTDVEPQIGKIVGTYLNQGTVPVEVCGWRAGITSCGTPIPNVTFGPSLCSHRPTPPPPCPGNLVRCPPTGTCRSQCEHLQ